MKSVTSPDTSDYQHPFEYVMVFVLKILQKKTGLNGSENWQKSGSHWEPRKEAAKGNGKKVDMLIADWCSSR